MSRRRRGAVDEDSLAVDGVSAEKPLTCFAGVVVVLTSEVTGTLAEACRPCRMW